MNTQSYALDSSTLIRILRKNPSPLVVANFSNAVLSGANITIPQPVHFEMLRGFFYANATTQEIAYRKFCDKYFIGRFTDATWERAAKLYSDLRKNGWNVGDSDILIGAFCIENKCTIVTTNTKHFENMTNLTFVDWTQ